MRNKSFYFDYAASTPVDTRVEVAMKPYFLEEFGNAGSLHSFGQEALAAVDRSREIIAKAVGVDFRGVVFTGSATEANNLALRGVVKSIGRPSDNGKPRLIVSAIEHESVLETARDLEQDGIEVVYLPVDRNGIVKLGELKSALDERTVLVSVMYANNETGTIQPTEKIARVVKEFRLSRSESIGKNPPTSSGCALYPLFHTDAVQAFQFLNCSLGEIGADMMTLSAHKIYGPKGIGALCVRRNNELRIMYNGKQNSESKKSVIHNSPSVIHPLITGGGQEFGLRSGTENVPLIAGFGKAVEIAVVSKDRESRRAGELRNYFWNSLKRVCPQAQVNGDLQKSLPNIINIYFPGYEAQDLLTRFDLAGLAVSAGSACSARSAEPSYVIKALGYSEDRARRSIRFSFGRPTRKTDIDKIVKFVEKLVVRKR